MALYLGGNSSTMLLSLDGYTLQDTNNTTIAAFPASAKRKIIINNVVYRVNLNLKESE